MMVAKLSGAFAKICEKLDVDHLTSATIDTAKARLVMLIGIPGLANLWLVT